MSEESPAARQASDLDYQARLETLLDSVMTPAQKYRRIAIQIGIIAVIAAVLYLSALDTNVSLAELIQGIPAIANYISRMYPPDWEYTRLIMKPTLETVEIAIWGTVLGILLGIPLGLMAARNISPHLMVYGTARFMLNSLRGVSELVFALIFVSAVGLGPFPGILALALHNAGMLGKFYAEAIESIDPGPMEALEATGASWLQMVVFAIVPQVIPHFVTYNLYRFEVSIRAATVLGLVGAGGIGFHLISSIRLFDYRETAVVLIVIIMLVVITDYLGSRLRAKII
jgi:phosphonate transport system permease protein